ncbi:hypothetical protein [Pseudoalteromonas galatheae]|uniref:hypothetical protein n=1 Tax=Pseudoalteromonas galatheae TaxID=579562 RepID=UPI0030CBC176
MFNKTPFKGTSRTSSGYSYDDDQFASKVFGEIARKDWQDYRNTFMPVHEIFKTAVMSDDLTKQQLDRIPGNIDAQFKQSQAQASAINERMGLSNLNTGRTDISKGLAQVFAENSARTHGKERKMSAIAGANISPQDARVNQ